MITKTGEPHVRAPAARQVRAALAVLGAGLLAIVVDLFINGTDLIPDVLGAALIVVAIVWLAETVPSQRAQLIFGLAIIPAALVVFFLLTADGGAPAGGYLPMAATVVLVGLGMREVARVWGLPLTLESWTTSLALVALAVAAHVVSWTAAGLAGSASIELDGVGLAAVGVALIVVAFLVVAMHPLVSILRSTREIALGPLDPGRGRGRLVGVVALALAVGALLLVAFPDSRVNQAFARSYPNYDLTPLFHVEVDGKPFHVRLAELPENRRFPYLVHMGWGEGGGRRLTADACMPAVDFQAVTAPDGRELLFGIAVADAAEVRWTQPDGTVERVMTQSIPGHPLRYYKTLGRQPQDLRTLQAYDEAGHLLGGWGFDPRAPHSGEIGIHDRRAAELCWPQAD